MSDQPFNTESILKQFDIVEKSLQRAKLPFEVDFTPQTSIEVTLYELIKSYHQIENIIREIDPKRFGVQRVSAIHLPMLDVERLHLCPYCGNPECQSDHK